LTTGSTAEPASLAVPGSVIEGTSAAASPASAPVVLNDSGDSNCRLSSSSLTLSGFGPVATGPAALPLGAAAGAVIGGSLAAAGSANTGVTKGGNSLGCERATTFGGSVASFCLSKALV
jgi:hypothetical protein